MEKRIEINATVSPTQFARFAETAKSEGKSVSALLRSLVIAVGTDAEGFKKVKGCQNLDQGGKRTRMSY